MNPKLAKAIVYGAAIGFVIVTFWRLAHADIPPKNGGYYPPPTVVQPCLETYWKPQGKAMAQFYCDRVFAGGFQ